MLKRRTERRQADREVNATLRLVLFQVGAERYGLDITGVREIDRLHAITRVPQALSFVEGVIHLRGAIIPVIDLARRFGQPPTVPGRQTRIIVAHLAGQNVGLIVDAVAEVIAIPAKSVGAPPPLTFERTARFVSGMARVGEGLVAVLSLDRLLSAEEVEQLSLL
jgi:purine-binding chemotaxis protein CheW